MSRTRQILPLLLYPPGPQAETGQLAADLRDATANLTAWVEIRAAELAADAITRAETEASARIAAVEREAEAERTRHADLLAELRRHVEVMDRFQQKHIRGRCVPAGEAGR